MYLAGSFRQESYICSMYTELEPDRKESVFVDKTRFGELEHGT